MTLARKVLMLSSHYSSHAPLEGEQRQLNIDMGTGQAKREFLSVDDLADACIYLMYDYSSFDPISIGSGNVVSEKILD